jgi:hypothetical protein
LLTKNTTYYLSAAGNDANDGLTSTTAKKTWAAMHTLLAGIDPCGYTVTVMVSGMITAGSNVFSLPQFSPGNCVISGTDQATDGFSDTVNVTSGGFTPDKIAFGRLQSTIAGKVHASGKTIRMIGLSPENVAFQNSEGGGSIQLSSCTIEYSGAYTNFVYCIGGKVWLNSCTYTPIDSPTLSGQSIFLNVSGEVSINNPAAMPGGGTVRRSNPGYHNAFGAPVAQGLIAASGAAASVQNIGISSSTKTGTGVYELTLSGVTGFVPYALISALSGGPNSGSVNARWIAASSTLAANTYDAAGAPADRAFSIFIPR